MIILFMKNLTIILMLLYNFVALAQKDVADINAFIGIPALITNESEIRIYKDYGITNRTDLFRMYKDPYGKWNAELYQYGYAVGNVRESFSKRELTAIHDTEFVWCSIMLSNIDLLPEMKAFMYKLERNCVIYNEGEFAISSTRSIISDGTSYEVFTKINHINYFNPETYLKIFPGVDELESFCNMLKFIREEFNIWEER